MKQFMFLILLIILALGLPLFFNLSKSIEGYTKYTLAEANGNFPDAQTKVLVQDTYPPIGKNELSNKTSNDIWQSYPIVELGSYAQVTNNRRYPNNPDEGTCMPAGMCDALYYNKNTGNNNVQILEQLHPNCGTRVGYFDTNVNLHQFKTDMQNILY